MQTALDNKDPNAVALHGHEKCKTCPGSSRTKFPLAFLNNTGEIVYDASNLGNRASIGEGIPVWVRERRPRPVSVL